MHSVRIDGVVCGVSGASPMESHEAFRAALAQMCASRGWTYIAETAAYKPVDPFCFAEADRRWPADRGCDG